MTAIDIVAPDTTSPIGELGTEYVSTGIVGDPEHNGRPSLDDMSIDEPIWSPYDPAYIPVFKPMSFKECKDNDRVSTYLLTQEFSAPNAEVDGATLNDVMSCVVKRPFHLVVYGDFRKPEALSEALFNYLLTEVARLENAKWWQITKLESEERRAIIKSACKPAPILGNSQCITVAEHSVNDAILKSETFFDVLVNAKGSILPYFSESECEMRTEFTSTDDVVACIKRRPSKGCIRSPTARVSEEERRVRPPVVAVLRVYEDDYDVRPKFTYTPALYYKSLLVQRAMQNCGRHTVGLVPGTPSWIDLVEDSDE